MTDVHRVDVRNGRFCFRYVGRASLDELSVFIGVQAGGLSSLPVGVTGTQVPGGEGLLTFGGEDISCSCFGAGRFAEGGDAGVNYGKSSVEGRGKVVGGGGDDSVVAAHLDVGNDRAGDGGSSAAGVSGGVESRMVSDAEVGDVEELCGTVGAVGSVGVGLGGALEQSSVQSLVESNTERNRRWRRERKDRKKKRQMMARDWRKGSARSCSGSRDACTVGESGVLSGGEVDELRRSLEKKWRVENELAVERAERKLAVLRANDVAEESKQYRARILASTEKTRVSIERAYAELAGHGDIPGVVGSAETVVSGQVVPGLAKGSISPNSSASMAEFHAQQKALLDSEARNRELEERLKKVSAKVGFDCNLIDYMDKRTWTDTSENREILGNLMPGGYGMDSDGMPDGKFHPIDAGPDWY